MCSLVSRTRLLLCVVRDGSDEQRLRAAREVLGVGPNTSRSELKKAFGTLAMRHHPDRSGDSVEFHRVRKAFELLLEDKGTPRRTVNAADFEQNFREQHARSSPEWAEPGTRHGDIPQEPSRFTWVLVRLSLTFFLGSVMVFQGEQGRSPDGLTWLDRPHPAVLASQASTRRLSTRDKQELEKELVKVSAATEERVKFGPGIAVEGIGYFDYKTNTMKRSPAYLAELQLSKQEAPRARWKPRAPLGERKGSLHGTPPVRPEVPHSVPLPSTPSARQLRISELEDELKALRAMGQGA